MSMSEMSKARYKALRGSVRTNGLAYTVRTLCSVLEAEDVRAMFDAPSRVGLDLLAMRARFHANPLSDTKRSIVFCTTFIGEHNKAPLP